MKQALALLAAGLAVLGAGAQPADAVAPVRPEVLRVCADPDNLPLSHQDGTGFENRIARLIADDWGVPLQYAWLPDRRGFVRKTMGEGLCDVIVGVPVGFERTATTLPYYRSSYVLVDRASAESPPVSFDDPRLRRLRVGVQLIGDDMAAAPPGHALARHGATANVRGFPVVGEEPSALRMVRALERGELDALFAWGPQVGWFARGASSPLRVTTATPPDDLPREIRFDFAIAMGVRRADKGLRAALDEVIRRRQPDIDRILDDYAVPRVEPRP